MCIAVSVVCQSYLASLRVSLVRKLETALETACTKGFDNYLAYVYL